MMVAADAMTPRSSVNHMKHQEKNLMKSLRSLVSFYEAHVEVAHAQAIGSASARQCNVCLPEFKAAFKINIQIVNTGALNLVNSEAPSESARCESFEMHCKGEVHLMGSCRRKTSPPL
jgi:hypothetical protein